MQHILSVMGKVLFIVTALTVYACIYQLATISNSQRSLREATGAGTFALRGAACDVRLGSDLGNLANGSARMKVVEESARPNLALIENGHRAVISVSKSSVRNGDVVELKIEHRLKCDFHFVGPVVCPEGGEVTLSATETLAISGCDQEGTR
jgi:hypothetical protein